MCASCLTIFRKSSCQDEAKDEEETNPLPAEVEDPDLGVRDSTVEPTLGVGLVLAVAVALRRTPPHGDSETTRVQIRESEINISEFDKSKIRF